jgi:hypothetical protein
MSIADLVRDGISSVGKEGEGFREEKKGGFRRGGFQQTNQRGDTKKQIVFFVEKLYSLTREMRLS